MAPVRARPYCRREVVTSWARGAAMTNPSDGDDDDDEPTFVERIARALAQRDDFEPPLDPNEYLDSVEDDEDRPAR